MGGDRRAPLYWPLWLIGGTLSYYLATRCALGRHFGRSRHGCCSASPRRPPRLGHARVCPAWCRPGLVPCGGWRGGSCTSSPAGCGQGGVCPVSDCGGVRCLCRGGRGDVVGAVRDLGWDDSGAAGACSSGCAAAGGGVAALAVVVSAGCTAQGVGGAAGFVGGAGAVGGCGCSGAGGSGVGSTQCGVAGVADVLDGGGGCAVGDGGAGGGGGWSCGCCAAGWDGVGDCGLICAGATR